MHMLFCGLYPLEYMSGDYTTYTYDPKHLENFRKTQSIYSTAYRFNIQNYMYIKRLKGGPYINDLCWVKERYILFCSPYPFYFRLLQRYYSKTGN